MRLDPKTAIHGFSVIESENLPEIGGFAHVMRHEKSGARLLFLENDDNNKAFSIGFRTPPKDYTGVFHILEHSVLCGSDRFPVKEPFVDLLKGSMQTFLNAMTFPDKTMYPVASTNERDLFNLMDVYLDAVFHPAIYNKKTIFQQEGWHLEIADTQDDESQDCKVDGSCKADDGNCEASGSNKLVYNGVVYNEMKGALSDSSSVMFDQMQQALFPNTAYAFESGGTPQAIPTLTYDEFLDEHRRHYRLDNSYTVLYGDLDIEATLKWLDERYFSPVFEEEAAQDAERKAYGLEKLRPRQIELEEPVAVPNIVKEMKTAPENAVSGTGYVIGTFADRKRTIATEILLDALLGSNESPMKRALLDRAVAEDISAFTADGLAQPFAVIQYNKPAENVDLDAVFVEEMRKLLDRGIDMELVEASLSHAEFVMREHDFGYADGVVAAINSLAGWLYDDDMPTLYLQYEDDFRSLRDALSTSYFTDLAQSLFLDNGHRAHVDVIPVEYDVDNEQEIALNEKAGHLTDAELKQIEEDVELLRKMQTEPDSPEAIATLPRLSISDIQDAPQETMPDVYFNGEIECLRHHVDTRGITYAYRYFDVGHLSFEDLPYLSILAMVLGKLGTAQHTAAQIDTLTQGKLGNLSFFTDVYEDRDDISKIMPRFVVSSSALEKNTSWISSLPQEIILETDFSDTAKIKDILLQRKIALEQGFAGVGHSAAMARVRSYYAPAGVVHQQLSGVDFYIFLKHLLENFDENSAQLAGRLGDVANRLFVDNGCTISFAGTDDAYDAFWNNNPICNRTAEHSSELAVPEPQKLNEAFIVPSDVTYTATGYDRRLIGKPYTGVWSVAARALSYDFLWNEVRVKGGAYGVGFQSTATGNMRFYSYRDPHIDETLERYAASSEYLRSFAPSKEDMDGFVVSSVAGFDTPKKARDLVRRQAGMHFASMTQDERKAVRSQIAGASVEDVRALADVVERIANEGAVCTFGNKEIIEKSHAQFTVRDLFNE